MTALHHSQTRKKLVKDGRMQSWDVGSAGVSKKGSSNRDWVCCSRTAQWIPTSNTASCCRQRMGCPSRTGVICWVVGMTWCYSREDMLRDARKWSCDGVRRWLVGLSNGWQNVGCQKCTWKVVEWNVCVVLTRGWLMGLWMVERIAHDRFVLGFMGCAQLVSQILGRKH